jgi:ribosomal protein L11 methylase PrmA
LTADVIVPLLPALLGATCGRLVLSGILETQTDTIRDALARLGVHDFETAAAGEWIAIII